MKAMVGVCILTDVLSRIGLRTYEIWNNEGHFHSTLPEGRKIRLNHYLFIHRLKCLSVTLKHQICIFPSFSHQLWKNGTTEYNSATQETQVPTIGSGYWDI